MLGDVEVSFVFEVARYHTRMLKSLFLLLVLLGAAGYAGYYFSPQNMPAFVKPERRACQRMVDQCETKDPDKLTSCVDIFAEFRKTGGDDSVKKPIACMMESKSCLESAGCIGGAAGNQMLQLLKGLGGAIDTGLIKSLGQ